MIELSRCPHDAPCPAPLTRCWPSFTPAERPAGLGDVAHAAAAAATQAARAVADELAREVHAVEQSAKAVGHNIGHSKPVQTAQKAMEGFMHSRPVQTVEHAAEAVAHSKPVEAAEHAVGEAATLAADVGATLAADVEGYPAATHLHHYWSHYRLRLPERGWPQHT